MADSRRGGFDNEARLVRTLASILDETGLSEIEVEVGQTRVRVARTAAGVVSAPTQPMAALAAPLAPALAEVALAEEPAAPSGELVKSPMVGTAYLQPTPGAEPFIRAGSRVSAGQTLVLIEAMKTMNPIPAPRDGTVAEILIEDGAPVEFGEPLVVLD